MFATIYVDASFDAETGVAGWAMYARCQEDRLEHAQGHPERLTSAFEAELVAAVEALARAKARWPSLRRALVKSDCEGVRVHLELREPPRGLTPFTRAMRERIRALDLERVIAQWVRGHQSTNQPDEDARVPAWCNDRVDRRARSAMQAQRCALGLAPAVEEGPRPRNPGRLAREALAPPEVTQLRERCREALARRFGAQGPGLRRARAWAAEQLGVHRVRVGALPLPQLERLLQAVDTVESAGAP